MAATPRPGSTGARRWTGPYRSGARAVSGDQRARLAHAQGRDFPRPGRVGIVALRPATLFGPWTDAIRVAVLGRRAARCREHVGTAAGLGSIDDFAGYDSPHGRLDAEIGYGLPALDGAATGTPWARLGLAEGAGDYRLGYRLNLSRGEIGFEFGQSAYDRDYRLGYGYGLAERGGFSKLARKRRAACPPTIATPTTKSRFG